METHLLDEEGINIQHHLNRLWEKRSFIIIILLISIGCGITVSIFLPRTYNLEGKIKLTNQDSISQNNIIDLITWSEISFDHLKNTGKLFYDNNSENRKLNISDSDQKLLSTFRNTLTFNINDHILSISSQTKDTTNSSILIKNAQTIFQKYIKNLHETYSLRNVKLIQKEYEEAKLAQIARLKILLELQEKNKKHSTIESLIEEKLLTEEYELYSTLYANILKRLEKVTSQLKPLNTKIVPIVSTPNPSQLSRKSVCMRFIFFGFLGSIAYVLGTAYYREIFKKKIN